MSIRVVVLALSCGLVLACTHQATQPPAGKPEFLNSEESLKRGPPFSEAVRIGGLIFLADIGEWATFNEVYREFFKPPYPARSALGANGLAMGARLEVECIAYVQPTGP